MGRRTGLVAFLSVMAAAIVSVAAGLVPAVASGQQVLRVGTYHGIPGQFSSIQAAVDAARPGDFVLVGPGDYKTTSYRAPSGGAEFPAGVLITTPNVTLRGMDRGGVVVDGTRPGSPQCSAAAGDQNYGAQTSDGTTGINGIMVWKADDVAVQNLTACNFLAGPAGNSQTGNEIWWNGGANSGHVGGWGYRGSYLTTTSTFFSDESTAAQYGIFSSNWSGGTWDQIYASNFNDSGFYIGACQQICDQTLNHGWSEYNALGYSGTNSGGQLVIENSQFDNNEDGFDTNSQNADEPSPQNGDCPGNGISPITHTHSCWVFMHNNVHDNNNPNVPTAGSAAAGPVGTGMSVSGARNDTIMDNTFANNGAWGTIFVPYPDSGPPCTGGTLTPAACIFDEWGDALIGNTYSNNGFFGNPTNGDYGAVNTEPRPTDCYSGNVHPDGSPATSSPSTLEATYPKCTGQTVPPNLNGVFLAEVACDSQADIGGASGSSTCLPTDHYPRLTKVKMAPLPSSLPPMPNPCAGVPANPWCSDGVTSAGGSGRSGKGSAGRGRGSACTAPTVVLPVTVAARERLVSVSISVAGGRAVAHRARGRAATVRFALPAGRAGRRVRVHVVEHLLVAGHRETTTFTRVYTTCRATRGTARRRSGPVFTG